MKDYIAYDEEENVRKQMHFPKTCSFCLGTIANIPNDLVKICRICGHVYMKEEWVCKRYNWGYGKCMCKSLVEEGVIESQKEYFNWLEQEYLNTWGEKLPDYR